MKDFRSHFVFNRSQRNGIFLLGVIIVVLQLIYFLVSRAPTTVTYSNDPELEIFQKKIDSLDLPYQVVNAGLSGETTAGGRSRLDWVLNQEVDVFVLELGANDGLRGVPVAESRKNLQAIIEAVKENNPNVSIILTGMQMPPNMGREYTEDFSNMFPELAEENDILLIPFLLENVGGIPELNQSDGIHPTAEGQKIMAETVWKVLEPELQG